MIPPSLSRIFSALIGYAPAAILIVSTAIGLFIYDISRTADEFLDSNYLHHMDTRSIIKANLLVQRGVGKATVALQSDDQDAFYSALDQLDGALTFQFSRVKSRGLPDEATRLIEELLQDFERLGVRFFTKGDTSVLAEVQRLQEKADRIFSMLAADDNRNWTETVSESAEKNHTLHQLYIFFFFLILFLGGIVVLVAIAARQSRRAERSLQILAQELESRIEERTEELSVAYQELAGQTKLLQKILDTIPAPIFYKDAEGVYLGCNKAFEAYIGLPASKVIGSTVYDVAPKELADVYYLADNDLIQSGGTQVYEASVRYADTSQHDVIFHKAVFHNDDGTPGGQVGAMLDITDRKKAEAALIKNEQLFHGMFDQSFSFIALLSPEGTLLEVNHTAMKGLPVAKDVVLGRSFWETPWWQHSANAQTLLRREIESAASGEVVRFETTNRVGGGLLDIDCTLKPILNDQQDVIYVIAEGRDISKIKQHEKILLSIAEGISSGMDGNFFSSLVLTMSEIMEADYAFVGQFKAGQSDSIETLAYCEARIAQKNFIYSLENTPCQEVFSRKKICSYPEGAARLFPEDLPLQKMGIEGYVGIPLISTGGEVLGILVSLFRRPMGDVATVEQLVKIFGTRAANELERQQNLRRLKESEENFRTIFQTSPDAAVVSRFEDGCIIDCNDGFTTYTGYKKEEVLGKNSLDIGLWVNYEDRDKMYELLKRDGFVENFEFPCRKKDGTIGTALLSLRTFKLRGDPHMLVVNRDITEIKKAQQALLESEKRYRELYTQFQVLLDGIPDALLLFSRKLKVVWANQGAANHFSRPVEELEGLSCNDVWCGHLKDCVECMDEVFVKGQTLDKSTKSGDGRYWGVKTFPIKDAAGRVVNAIQIASDITEKIRLREQANQASRLAALGELSAGVAHEINNPNAQLLLNIPLLGEALADSLPILDEYRDSQGDFRLAGVSYAKMRQEVPRLLNGMQDAAERIRTIVDDLKNFARDENIDQGQEFSLNDALETAVRLSGNTIKNSTHSFEVVYGEGLPQIVCVRQRIEQVLVNLIINACQSLPDPDCAILVRTWHDETQNKVICEVCDEGVGMSEEILAHVTDPFFTTRREVGGTGLGLSISARIIREHGGELTITSQEGQGSRVVVSFNVK